MEATQGPEAELAESSPRQPARSPAAELFWKGHESYSQRRYAEALDFFQQAYDLSPQPELVFNMAQAYRALGQCDSAASALSKFVSLGVGPGLEQAEAQLAELSITCPERESEQAAVQFPAPEAVPEAPTLSPGAVAAQPLPTSSLELRSAPDSDASAGLAARRAVAWSSIGAGTLAAFGAVAFALQASSKQNELERYAVSAASRHAVWDEGGAEIEQSGERAEALGVVFGGASLTLITLGAVLLFTESESDSRSAPRGASGGLQLQTSASGVGASFGGLF